ncbi:MAG: DUF1285 domain-containing protein [Alphaproteobacteria bacterium]|nr:DUF1285 domain-containing protein [Alphaproteobacteria bacterium]
MTEPRRSTGPTRSREQRPTVAVDLRIARDGTWYHDGAPIRRAALVKLFADALVRGADGAIWLETPAERARVAVDDAPFVAVDVDTEGQGEQQTVIFRTNVGDRVAADAQHPIRVAFGEGGEPAPYVLVRAGLEALIGRAAYYRLVAMGVERRQGDRVMLGVWSGGQFFSLGETGDA